jgi:hypothetical protein
MLKIMLKKGLSIFISILLLLPLFTGVVGFSQMISGDPPSFQKTCDMDNCNPNMPKCPLCPSSGFVNLFLPHETGACLPVLTSSLILICLSTLSDQGFVQSIFHPPTSIS